MFKELQGKLQQYVEDSRAYRTTTKVVDYNTFVRVAASHGYDNKFNLPLGLAISPEEQFVNGGNIGLRLIPSKLDDAIVHEGAEVGKFEDDLALRVITEGIKLPFFPHSPTFGHQAVAVEFCRDINSWLRRSEQGEDLFVSRLWELPDLSDKKREMFRRALLMAQEESITNPWYGKVRFEEGYLVGFPQPRQDDGIRTWCLGYEKVIQEKTLIRNRG